MTKILTPEDKKYLRFFGKYLQSYGEKIATFRIEDWTPDYTDVRERLHPEENYYLEVPERLHPILQKISDNLSGLDPNYVSDDINTTWAEFVVDTEKQSIHVEFCYDYYSKDEQGMSWDESEISADDLLSKIMDDLKESNVPYMSVKFDGSGDSGSIEGAEDEDGDNIELPADIEDWCYNQLESNYGGWEINEGSNGEFIFNTNKKEVYLDFSWNNQNTECDTFYEEKFDN